MRIIGGLYKNTKLLSPKGKTTRPTASFLRESVFNRCQSIILEANVLDLFAGSGSIGIEAISRGALHATFVDKSKASVMAIKKNVEMLNLKKQTTVVFDDVFRYLKRLKTKNLFDLIYADPPYEMKVKDTWLSYNLLTLIDEKNILSDHGILFIEEGINFPDFNLSLQNLELKNIKTKGPTKLFSFVKKGI